MGCCKGYSLSSAAVCCSTGLLSQKLTRANELYILRGLRFESAGAFNVRDVWQVERIAAIVTSDGLLKPRRNR